MALAWITEIRNHTKHSVLIKQTDPTKNPVVDAVVQGTWAPGLTPTVSWIKTPQKPPTQLWFTVGPETILKTSWFVVPWSNVDDAWVYLFSNKENKPGNEVDLGTCGVQFNVGPDGGGKQDYLQFYDRQLNPVIGTAESQLGEGQRAIIPVGPAGAAASTSGRLNITDQSITYQITESNSAGGDVVDALKGVGELIAIAAAVVAAGAGVAAIPKPVPVVP